MSSKRTFYDMYHEAWEIIDEYPIKIPFWKRMRLKQLLNQMLRKYNTR